MQTKVQILSGLDDFTRHYLIAAIWTGLDWDKRGGDNPTNLDECDIKDFSMKALLRAIDDCKAFQKDNKARLDVFECGIVLGPDCENAAQRAGHEFSLTRNHHGSGFWDCSYNDDPEEGVTKTQFKAACQALTDASHKFGEINVYRTGKILHFE